MKQWTKFFIGIGALVWIGCADETTVYNNDPLILFRNEKRVTKVTGASLHLAMVSIPNEIRNSKLEI